MPKLTIDQREVEVPPGATILDAARKLNVQIPTLCHLDGYPPPTSCLLCVVRLCPDDRVAPSCATVAQEGMAVESETEEIHQLRRSALELLLSDHLGDCLAPCQLGCPAHMDVPRMLRQIAAGELRQAIVTVKSDIALPAVLGRICPAPCEKVCRRRPADAAVAICRLKRLVADVDLASDDPYVPVCRPDSGKRVAVIGAGPAGLSAAYHLRRQGHACTVFDENQQPGGRLRHETDRDLLPRDVLDADIDQLLRSGIELCTGVRIDGTEALAELRSRFDAVLIACGATAKDQVKSWGVSLARRGIEVDRQTYQTGLAGVFAVGNAVRTKGLVVRSTADGKQAAAAIDQLLAGRPVTGPEKPFNTRIGHMQPDEISQLLAAAGRAPRRDPAAGTAAGFTTEEAAEQAARCMHCDCRKPDTCRLRQYSHQYRADPRRYKAQRRRFQQDTQHAQVIYEPGKCIDCGLCIEIARRGGEPLGLTFVGRGFDVRVAVPLDRSMSEALDKMAAECVAACPTAALSLKSDSV